MGNSPRWLLFATSKLRDPVIVPLRVVLVGLIELIANADIRSACILEWLVLSVVILVDPALLAKFAVGCDGIRGLPITRLRYLLLLLLTTTAL